MCCVDALVIGGEDLELADHGGAVLCAGGDGAPRRVLVLPAHTECRQARACLVGHAQCCLAHWKHRKIIRLEEANVFLHRFSVGLIA